MDISLLPCSWLWLPTNTWLPTVLSLLFPALWSHVTIFFYLTDFVLYNTLCSTQAWQFTDLRSAIAAEFREFRRPALGVQAMFSWLIPETQFSSRPCKVCNKHNKMLKTMYPRKRCLILTLWSLLHLYRTLNYRQITYHPLLNFLHGMLTLQMEAVCLSETSVTFYQTTYHYILEQSKHKGKAVLTRGCEGP